MCFTRYTKAVLVFNLFYWKEVLFTPYFYGNCSSLGLLGCCTVYFSYFNGSCVSLGMVLITFHWGW